MSTIAAKLSKLKDANYRETEVLKLPDGTELILSTLTGDEDLELAEYLNEFVENAFGHHTKLETLAHSVKWFKIDGEEVDLRGVRMIETGDTLDDGTPISRRKHVFMRPIVRSWPDVVIDTLFTRYAKLMEDLETDLGKGIKVELGAEALRMKIMTMAMEVASMVEAAASSGVELPPDLLDFRKGSFKADGGDALLEALGASGTAPPPEPEQDVHPIDEQLERERAENPEVYPIPKEGGVVQETPQRVRK